MSQNFKIIVFFCVNLLIVKSARILVFIPTASLSHQVVFRPLTQELARRGHEVVVITTNPAFSKENAPINLIEIDVSDAAYTAMNLGFAGTATGKNDDTFMQMKSNSKLLLKTFEAEINTDEVQAMIKDNNQRFDLLILEACVTPTLVLSHIFKAPVILFSTLPTYDAINEYTGTFTHPLLYPTLIHQKINNLTMWEKVQEMYKHYLFESLLAGEFMTTGDEILKNNFGADTPPLKELRKNVDMVFLAEHHIWDNNRPVPPGVIYVGGIYPSNNITKELSEDIKTFLDSSPHGAIYMSFGTNVKTSLLPQEKIQMFLKVFSQLPYNVLLKWDFHELPNATTNMKIFKWLPQAALLHHPKIKLFITQGGLQSTADAIDAGVPLIGIPMLVDQWYNVEQYVRLKIGLRLDMESVTEEKIISAIKMAIEDNSYRHHIEALRTLFLDQPQTALERAVWWTEHVIRHQGARHLRAPTALITNWDYFELDLVLILASIVILIVALLTVLMYNLLKYFIGIRPSVN